MKHGKRLFALLLAALLLALLCCGCGGGKKQDASPDAQQGGSPWRKDVGETPSGKEKEAGPYEYEFKAPELPSLLDYAKKLEDAGNPEAAAAVYDLIAKGAAGGELAGRGREGVPALGAAEELELLRALFGKEADGQ